MAHEGSEGIINLSNQNLTRIEYLPGEWPVVAIYDQNEIVKIENLEKYHDLQQLSIAENKLIYMHGVSKLANITVLNLPNNQILAIDGLKNLLKLTWLNLSGNRIKTIDHLDNNVHLKHLDLSDNKITTVGNLYHLHRLKTLLLHGNQIQTLRTVPNYLSQSIEILSLAENQIHDLNEVRFLSSLTALEQLSIMNNPCIKFPSQDLIFDYRPYVVNWCLKLRILDGYSISEKESLKAEWLYSQGKGRSFQPGQHLELIVYLTQNCPIATLKSDANEDEKLAKILHKQRYHQKQLKRESPVSHNKERQYSGSPNSNYPVEVPVSLYEGHVPVRPIKAWSDHNTPPLTPEDSVRSRLNARQVTQINQSNLLNNNSRAQSQYSSMMTPVPPSSQEPRHHGQSNGNNPLLHFRARHLYSPINESQRSIPPVTGAAGDTDARKSGKDSLSATNTSLLDSESVYLPIYSQGSPVSGAGAEISSPESLAKLHGKNPVVYDKHTDIGFSPNAFTRVVHSKQSDTKPAPPENASMLNVCDINSSDNDADSSDVEDLYYNGTNSRPNQSKFTEFIDLKDKKETAASDGIKKRHIASRSSKDVSDIAKSFVNEQPSTVQHLPTALDSRTSKDGISPDSRLENYPSTSKLAPANRIPHSRLAINFQSNSRAPSSDISMQELHVMATRIQALWRGHYCRTRNPRVRHYRQNSLQQRTIQHIAFLQSQMDLYYQNYEKEKKMRELQNEAVAYLMEELREIKEWKKTVEPGISSILTGHPGQTMASTAKDAPPLTMDTTQNHELHTIGAQTDINQEDSKVAKLEATCRQLESEVFRLSTTLANLRNQFKDQQPFDEATLKFYSPAQLKIVERNALSSPLDTGWVQFQWSASKPKESDLKEKIKSYIVLLNGCQVAEVPANRLTVRIDLSNTRVDNTIHLKALGIYGSQSDLSKPLLVNAIPKPASKTMSDENAKVDNNPSCASVELEEDDSVREVSEIPTEEDSDREEFIQEAMKIMDMPDSDDSGSVLGSTTKEREDNKKTAESDGDSNIDENSDSEDQKANTAIMKPRDDNV